jgi:hypothetical protein
LPGRPVRLGQKLLQCRMHGAFCRRGVTCPGRQPR